MTCQRAFMLCIYIFANICKRPTCLYNLRLCLRSDVEEKGKKKKGGAQKRFPSSVNIHSACSTHLRTSSETRQYMKANMEMFDMACWISECAPACLQLNGLSGDKAVWRFTLELVKKNPGPEERAWCVYAWKPKQRLSNVQDTSGVIELSDDVLSHVLIFALEHLENSFVGGQFISKTLITFCCACVLKRFIRFIAYSKDNNVWSNNYCIKHITHWMQVRWNKSCFQFRKVPSQDTQKDNHLQYELYYAIK